MIKKIIVIAGLCLLGGYLIFAVFFFEKKPQNQVCQKFEIAMNDNMDERFIKPGDIEKFITSKGLDPKGKKLKNINTLAIQEAILSNKIIKSAEVFITSDGNIRAVVKERIPVLRVMASQGDNYYIDKDGEKMPLSNQSSAYLPIATGNIKEQLAKTDLYKFALFLQRDEFWNAQIEQIVVQSDNDIILITRVGNHDILMGKLDNYEAKLERLKTFYKKVLSQTGWNKYSKISLKYDKQIVGTKR